MAAALVALAGCGGGDGPGRADFARRADAICAPSLRELRAIERQLAAVAAGSEPDAIYARSAVLVRRRAAVGRERLAAVEALDRPSALDDRIGALIAGGRRQAALTDALAAAYAAQDQTRIARRSEALDVLDERNAASAVRLGMRVCGQRAAP